MAISDSEQNARILAVLGDGAADLDFLDGVERFYAHLKKSLQLPCEVTGIEDFDWEEYYVVGPGGHKDYTILKQTQPSFSDSYMLLGVDQGIDSEWMMFPLEDLTAHVQRNTDHKEFYLGLSELKAIDRDSGNYQLLDDYAVWFVNNR